MAESKDVIDAIRDSNLDTARDVTRDLLYQKAADYMSSRKEQVASNISQTLSVDVDDVHTFEDIPTEVEPEVDAEVTPEQETETPEPEEPTDATDHGND
jgi:Mg/Co/Ni transporter MgtE